MRSDFQGAGTVDHSGTSSSDPPNQHSAKAAYLSSIFISPFSIFEGHKGTPLCERKASGSRSNGWALAIKRVMSSGSMRRIKEHVLGYSKSNNITSNSDIWLLGVCYKPSTEDSPHSDPVSSSRFAAFVEDFSSRLLLTYRKGLVFEGFLMNQHNACAINSDFVLWTSTLTFQKLHSLTKRN